MDGMKCFDWSQPRSFHYDFSHKLSISLCESLADFNIVKVVFKVFTVYIAKVIRNSGISWSPLQFIQCALNLLPSSLSLICINDLLTGLEVFFFTSVEVSCKLLIELCDLFPEVS